MIVVDLVAAYSSDAVYLYSTYDAPETGQVLEHLFSLPTSRQMHLKRQRQLQKTEFNHPVKLEHSSKTPTDREMADERTWNIPLGSQQTSYLEMMMIQSELSDANDEDEVEVI
jgi:hypothetical protein